MSATPRDRILARLRGALGGRDVLPHPGGFPGAMSDERKDRRVDEISSRLRDAGAEVVSFDDGGEASEWLRRFQDDFRSTAVSPLVPESLRPTLPLLSPDAADLGVSVARRGAADTGTVVLGSEDGRGLQLLPPTHLVWLPSDSIEASLTGALKGARSEGLPSALALHSGPSKSADIGRIMVTGVHGPGRLVVAVVREWPSR